MPSRARRSAAEARRQRAAVSGRYLGPSEWAGPAGSERIRRGFCGRGASGGQGEVRRAWAAVGGHRWGWGAAEGRTQGSASRKGGRGAEGVFRGFV